MRLNDLIDYVQVNITDLMVAVLLSLLGAYLIAHGTHTIGERLMQEATVGNVYATIVVLVFPLTGVVFIAAAIIVLLK